MTGWSVLQIILVETRDEPTEFKKKGETDDWRVSDLNHRFLRYFEAKILFTCVI